MALPITIRGRVLHQPGPWGSKRPLRNVGQVEVFLQNSTLSSSLGMATTDQDGWFNITGNPPSFSVTNMFIQVVDPCKVIMHSQLIPRPPNTNASILPIDDLGDITVPWEPADTILARVKGIECKDTQTLARTLSSTLSILLKSPRNPFWIALRRESVDGTGNDYTPAQRLLISLKAPRSGFLKRLVEDIQDEVVSTKSNNISDMVVEILQRLSMWDIKVLETGSRLNRLLAAIQRAINSPSYSESMMVDPAHDMAAACVFLFLAFLIEKRKVQPNIMFFSNSRECSGSVKHQFSVIHIE